MELDTVEEDHRVRLARERRKHMKAHLLDAVMAVRGEGAPNSRKVIDDVVEYAGVSRGTFYKYFGSLDEAIAELVSQLAEDMTIGILPVYNQLKDPRERTATGLQIFMRRAMLEPHWGGFIAHIGLLTTENLLIQCMVADIKMGMQAGLYTLANIESGLDFLVGTKVEAIRRITREREKIDKAYPQIISALILRAFGVSTSDAELISNAMAGRLDKEIPTFFKKDERRGLFVLKKIKPI